MSNLKKKKYIAGLLIVVLLVGIVGLFSYGKVDKYKGLIKVNKVKLLSSVGNTTGVTSKGTEEVSYNLTYTLDEVSGITKRDVIIKGKLSSDYASFKEIRRNNITSTLKDNGKEIEITIEDVTLGQEQTLEIPIQITNAPNNESVVPEIFIKEATGEETRVVGQTIRVSTNSVLGIVYDENNIPVGNIELSINKDGREIRRTYTREDGTYNFSDLEVGTYQIKVEEEIYEIVSGSETSESNPQNIIKVKEVDKFNIETHKYIEKLDLVINGKKQSYSYKDAEKVVQAIKNAKTISGQIEYKIVVRNKGEKNTAIERVVDEPGPGLEFKESKNTGWKKEDEIIKYKPIEGSTLSPKEKREIKLVLDITNTNEIKTYINKLTTRGEIKEKVAFVVDNRTVKEVSVVEGDKVERPNLEIDNLDGWYTDKNYTNKYKFSNEVYKDLILYAKTAEQAREYTVRFIDKGQVVTSETVEEGEKVNRPSDPEKTGYTFECWNKDNSCFDFNTEINENIDLESSYNVVTYNITYNLQEGTVTGNPTTYTVETDDFTLYNPVKEGYTFTGWTGTGLSNKTMSVTVTKGSTGNRIYTANYEINKYQLEIDPKGGIYEGNLLLNEDYGTIVTINTPTKIGYNFTGWTLSGAGTYNNGTYTFGLGNGKLEANYSPIEYTITYEGITDEERTSLNNPTSYTIETVSFTLNNPTNRLNQDNEGEVFVGWQEENDTTPSMTVTLPDASNLGNKKYTAIWNERQPNVYNITYNLNGGTLEETNPTTYKKSQLPITLNNPTKTGYTFTGWTGSNGDTPSNVTIPRGTEGDLSYTANYTPVTYTIDYDYTSCALTSEEITVLNNKESYTIEDSNFNLNNPSKTGKTFTGWTGTNLSEKTINVEVQTDKVTNLNYVANCTTNTYSVEFYNMKDDGSYELKTTIEDIDYNTTIPSNEVPTVTLRGYTFKYWSLDKSTEYNLETPVTSNLKIYAMYTKNVYPITYDLDGGSIGDGVTNPDSYSVDTEEFTLNNPSKTGYEFIGWTGSNGDDPLKVVTLPEEELGPKSYTANYTINKYTVTYMNGNDKFLEQTNIDYNTTTTAPSTNPTKAHNIFLKWLKEDNTEFDFSTPITEDITLYASFEEVEAPTITHAPTSWVRDKVTVTVSSTHPEYTYMYKVGSGSYQEYTEPFEVTENTNVYAYSVKNTITSTETSHVINNIDKINPTIIDLDNPESTPVSLTIKVTAQDNESGLDKFKVYVDNVEVFESDSYTSDLNDEKELTYTISGLEQITDYNVKVETYDKVGNMSYDEEVFTTPAKHYVAQIIGSEGSLFPDENLYVKFETLKQALEYIGTTDEIDCTTKQCTIQMLDEVTETNTILGGQDITIDLNGLTINGLQDKAFEVSSLGTLKIVDHNGNAIGKVYSEGTAIINNGKLFIGENEDELYVDANEPIIEGSVTGINSPGELHFLDGKVIGASTSGALKGSAPITPYSYNASVETTGGKEIATLEVIADAEARINSVYYTKVQEAVDSSKNGSYTQPEGTAEIMSQIQSKSDYIFVYDENTGTLKNNNQNFDNTTANSYVLFDLTNSSTDKVLSIDASVSSQYVYDWGYVTVTNTQKAPAYDQEEGRIIYISGVQNDNVNYVLEKGRKYYVHFGYYKNDSYSSYDDTFTINDIKLSDYVLDQDKDYIDEFISDSEYHFVKQSNGSLLNNNRNDVTNIPNVNAHSYIKIDLTGITDKKVLYVDMKKDAYNQNIGYVTVTNTKDMPEYDQEEGRQVYLTDSVDRTQYKIELIPDSVNYVHFCDRKLDYSYNTIIYSVKLQDTIEKEHLNSDITPSQNFYMYETNADPNIWKDLSGNDNKVIENLSNWDDVNGSFNIDTNNSYAYITGGITDEVLDEETVEVEFSTTVTQHRKVIYAGSNKEKILIATHNGNTLIVCNNNSQAKLYDLPDDFFDGTKKNLIVTYKDGNYEVYYNKVKLEKRTDSSWWAGNDNTYIGSNTGDNGYNFKGNIYKVNVYNRELSESEITGTRSNTGLLLSLDGSDHVKTNSTSAFINNNQYQPSTIADSYMTFDLTNLGTKTITVNAEISSELNMDYGCVYVNTSTNLQNCSDSSNRYVFLSGDVAAQDYTVTLTGGVVNYLHFDYQKDRDTDSGADTFKINNIKYYQDSNNTIPTYIFSNTTTKKDLVPEINMNTDVDTVQLLRNVSTLAPVEIEETRNVILDLNGYTLTTNKEDYVIKNNGNLTIIDSDYSNQIASANQKYMNEQVEYNSEYLDKTQAISDYYTNKQSEYDTEYNTAIAAENAKKTTYSDKFDEVSQSYLDYMNTPDYDGGYAIEEEYTYDYSGDEEVFTAPKAGTYILETWGASGGFKNAKHKGGYGGYSKGTISLNAGDKLYINVGGQGNTTDDTTGGYNGGGYGGSSGGAGTAGGATSIAKVSGQLKDLESHKGTLSSDQTYYISNDIVMVSGGGAGFITYGCNSSIGGSGGGFRGSNAEKGGTQTTAGSSTSQIGGSFGQGGYQNDTNYATPGGGGGFFGGGTDSNICVAGGGSGYIANPSLSDKEMYIYSTDSNLASNDTETKTILTSSVSRSPISNYAKE